MSIIESIRDFIATCPFIEELDTMFTPVNVDKQIGRASCRERV